jgi:hypothetical protein
MTRRGFFANAGSGRFGSKANAGFVFNAAVETGRLAPFRYHFKKPENVLVSVLALSDFFARVLHSANSRQRTST